MKRTIEGPFTNELLLVLSVIVMTDTGGVRRGEMKMGDCTYLITIKNCGSIGSSSFDSFSMLNRNTYHKSYLAKNLVLGSHRSCGGQGQ